MQPVQLSKNRGEWYTPHYVAHLAREALGGTIELDPASDDFGNSVIRAERFYSENGLEQSWLARTLFMNPPGGNQSVAPWWQKFVNLPDCVERIGILFRVAVDPVWFHAILEAKPVICFVRGRLHFIGDSDRPVHGNAIVYLGPNRDRFRKVFSVLGTVGEFR